MCRMRMLKSLWSAEATDKVFDLLGPAWSVLMTKVQAIRTQHKPNAELTSAVSVQPGAW